MLRLRLLLLLLTGLFFFDFYDSVFHQQDGHKEQRQHVVSVPELMTVFSSLPVCCFCHVMPPCCGYGWYLIGFYERHATVGAIFPHEQAPTSALSHAGFGLDLNCQSSHTTHFLGAALHLE